MIIKSDLQDYRQLNTLLSEIDEEIADAYNTYKSPAWRNDGAQKQISADSPTERALNRIRHLEEYRCRTYQKVLEIETFVDCIDEYLVQAVIRDHYMRGLTWEATCRHLLKHASKSAAIKLVDDYFEERQIK